MENAVALLKRLDEKRKSEKLEHYAPYDFQKRFHHAEGFNTPGVLASQRALIAANQIGKCVTIDSYIDRPNGYRSTVKELLKLGEAFSVIAWNENRKVDAMAFPVFKKKKKEPCVRLWMASGHWIECALEHRILSSQGSYVHVLDLVSSVPILRDSNLEYGPSIRVEDAPRWKKIGIGFLADCLEGFRLCDARLHGVRGIVQSAFQRLSDALQCSSASFVLDGYWSKCTNTYLPTFDRLSSQDVCRRFEARFVGWLSHAFDKFFQLLSENIVKVQRFSIAGVDRLQPSFVTPQRQVSPASSESINEGNRIISYELIGLKDVYDFEVPQWHTYCAAGMVHHNTRCGSMEIAMHLTGNYPKWWKGQRFIRPIDCLVASNTNETTRDICQDALFGDPSNDEMLGTGAIPKRCIGETTSKPGVPNAFDTVLVKHTSGGWSKVQFKAYEQGFKKFMGRPRDVNWLDEEPPQDIWSQIVRGTFARKDSVILVTLTPEEGLTEVVRQFLEQLKDGQALVRATWDDAPHMTPEMRANKLASIPEREREMRSKGVPLMGAGIVFPFPDEEIVIDPIPIPRHWPQIIGVDFGFNHPFAACNVAWDRDADVIYITADYRSSLTTQPYMQRQFVLGGTGNR